MKSASLLRSLFMVSILGIFLFVTASGLHAEEAAAPVAIPAPLGILKKIEGTLEIRRAGQVLAGKEGDAVHAGDQLKTGASDRTLLEFSADKSQVSITFDSVLVLSQKGVSLVRGLMWGLKPATGSGLSVQTPAADLTVQGAEYFVKVLGPDQTDLVVKEGSVDISYEGFSVRAGNMSQTTLQKGKQPVTQGIAEKLLNEQWAQHFA